MGFVSLSFSPIICSDFNSLVSNPPTMGNSLRSFYLLEVLVILPTDVGHLLLKDTELVLKVLKLRYQNGLFSILLTENLPHLVGLETFSQDILQTKISRKKYLVSFLSEHPP